MKFKNVKDVALWRMCVGCGACAYICPEKNIALADVVNDGIRPAINSDHCRECGECLKVCPGIWTNNQYSNANGQIQELKQGWGPVFEVWEGYASDPDIRHQGSSGGIASALALYCIEKEGMHGVLHIGPDEKKPYQNKTVFSRNRPDILSRTGSRYSPASPCDSLDQIESALNPSVFIGKPCDVAGLRKAQALKQKLKEKTGLAIGIFCAGTPATRGTLDLLKNNNINPEDVEEIRYRGKGWPGKFSVRLKGEKQPRELLTYMDAWGFVQKYRPYRCYLCPDGTSEFADISCGDPWYRERKVNESGYSLVLVRTERGSKILRGAMKADYVVLEKASPKILIASQINLLSKRGSIWGRLFTMKIFRVPTPRFEGFSLFRNWLPLSMKEKLRSVFGTARRVIQRKYYRPMSLNL